MDNAQIEQLIRSVEPICQSLAESPDMAALAQEETQLIHELDSLGDIEAELGRGADSPQVAQPIMEQTER